MRMATEVHVGDVKNAIHNPCAWCGRESASPLVEVTVITKRMVFTESICEMCREAFTDEDVD